MRRVVATFAFLVLSHLVFAFAMHGDFGVAGTLTVAAVGVAAILVLGIPAFLLLRRRSWFRAWQFVAGGAVLGLLCTIPFATGGVTVAASLAPLFVAIGALHGLIFWFLAIWRNAALTTPRA